MKKILLIALVLLSLPILLHVYQPAWSLGGWGLMLGAIGYFVSPILLFSVLLYTVKAQWK
jgi:hypothetical protein